MKSKFAAMLAVAGSLVPAAAWAFFEYPARPVHIVVGASPGDTNDLLARIVAPSLAQFFKQPFIVDNQPGSNGARAAALVAKSAADGHTLLMVSAPFATSVSLYPKLPYHPQRDFTPVARLAKFDQVLVVNSSMRIGNVAEFISLVRASPGRITIASAGTGSTSHLAAELMKVRAGWLSALHVPYRGHAPALASLLGNHVHALVTRVSSAQAHLKSGRLRGLAVASARRVPALPDVPTFMEAGYPGIEASGWSGIVVPDGTSYDTVVRLNLAIADILSRPLVRQRFAAAGAEPQRETPDQFSHYLHAELERWAKVVKAAGIGTE